MSDRTSVLVRGVGDVGSAVAVVLFRAGYGVALHDEPASTAPRRGMAFADAVFDGCATLDGLTAVRVNTLAELRDGLNAGDVLQVSTAPFGDVLDAVPWSAIVDARMRKRAVPEAHAVSHQIRSASARISSPARPSISRSKPCGATNSAQLSKPVRHCRLPASPDRSAGSVARALSTRRRPVASSLVRALAIVEEGAVVATIGQVALRAPIGGVLRGLTRNGVEVPVRTKVIEVDPRCDPVAVFGLGERPRRIAEGVVKAIAAFCVPELA